jgi:hypothetical protein
MSSQSDADRHSNARAPMGAGLVFLWVALMFNLAWFSIFAVSTATGIMQALLRPQPAVPDDVPVRAGGAQWALIEVAGPLILGLVLAYAMYRYYTRNRSLERDVSAHSGPEHDLSAHKQVTETVRA